jgi:lambda family phage portal protein
VTQAFYKLLGSDGKPIPKPAADPRRAHYDAARTTDENRRHWANADSLSPRSANNLGVRRALRTRSRYEQANSGYAGGLVRTLATDLIGTGPRLQCQADDDTANKLVEEKWAQWAESVGLNETLLTAKQAKTGDGEAFGIMVSDTVYDIDGNPEPVQLDILGIECDQVTTPSNGMPADLSLWVDGLEMDRRGRPTYYHVLQEHPGDTFNTSILFLKYERIAARNILHWFRRDRPGQVRGVPEITPGLPLCAQLRRWTLATLTAAEIAADFAVLLTTQANGDQETADPTPFETLEIERGLMTALPVGTDAKQMSAEHPTTEYSAFKGEILKEFGRATGTPENIVAGSSAQYNFSSGRLDYLLYRSAMRVERETCRRHFLDRVFSVWYAEAKLISGYIDTAGALPDRMPHGWYWPAFEPIDPQVEAEADTLRLSNGTTTLQELLAEYGQDWQVFMRQRSREYELMKSLGLPTPAWINPAATRGLPPAIAGEKPIAPAPAVPADEPPTPPVKKKAPPQASANGNGRYHAP